MTSSGSTARPGRTFWIVLSAITLAGALLRVLLAHDRAFLGDENGTLIYVCRSPLYILTHFREDRFEPWLTMNWFLLLEKGIAALAGEGFLAMRLVSILGGTGAIVLVALIATRWLPPGHALAAAALVAANPFLIQYSVIARSYAALLFCALLTGLLLLRFRERPDLGRGVALALAALAVGLVHLNGLFVLAWLGLVVAVDGLHALLDREARAGFARRIRCLVLPLVASVALVGLYYFQLRDDLMASRSDYGAEAFTPVGYVPKMLRIHLAERALVWPVVALAGLGAAKLARRRRDVLLGALFWLAVPIACASAAGYAHYPWAFARFHISLLPVVLALAVTGLGAVAGFGGEVLRVGGARAATGLLWAAVLGVIIVWYPRVAVEFGKKELRYQDAVAWFFENREGGDRIVGLTGLTHLHLRPYLECRQRMAKKKNRTQLDLLVRDPETSRVFLVWHTAHELEFGVETLSFGVVRGAVLPAEPKEVRLRRFEQGLERAIARLPENHLCEECYHLYYPAAAVTRYQGQRKVYLQYKTLADESQRLRIEREKNTEMGEEVLEE